MIDGSPEVMDFAINLHEDLVEMPSGLDARAHAINPSLAHLGSEHRAKAVPPDPHCLMADLDAAFVKTFFDIPQRKQTADV